MILSVLTLLLALRAFLVLILVLVGVGELLDVIHVWLLLLVGNFGGYDQDYERGLIRNEVYGGIYMS